MPALPMPALEIRDSVRAFALSLPGAFEDFPWDESAVVKVNKKIFVFLGAEGDTASPGIGLKLMDEASHGHALTVPGAAPMRYGLGRSGWVTIPPTGTDVTVELLRDWVEESYRTIAPKRLVARLDAD
ncbi:MmcQ/YjbR family DNA-binding protein [Streptomyces ehimensis]|uniref:MmcQ/YjbR family DNA-binding protein n=1 Tax=Streptomyces ehimensis TaxID=68195 RepID=A0ABV9B9R8_9ACTN